MDKQFDRFGVKTDGCEEVFPALQVAGAKTEAWTKDMRDQFEWTGERRKRTISNRRTNSLTSCRSDRERERD